MIMKTLMFMTLLLSLVACGEVTPEQLEMQKCVNHIQTKAKAAGDARPTYDRARQACEEFMKEDPFTKPWDEEGGD